MKIYKFVFLLLIYKSKIPPGVYIIFVSRIDTCYISELLILTEFKLSLKRMDESKYPSAGGNHIVPTRVERFLRNLKRNRD